MKIQLILYIVIVLLSGLLGAQYLEAWSLKKELSESMQALESKVSTFDSKLGRSQTAVIDSPELMKSLLREISSDIREDISSSFSNVEAILSARITNKTSGGGRVTRPRTKNKVPSKGAKELHLDANGTQEGSVSSNEEPFTNWEFKDWRLQASLVGEEFSYELNQTFDFSVVQTDNSYYLRVWELDSTSTRIEPPLVVHSFSATRLKKKEFSFKYLDPRLELSVTSLFDSFSQPIILPELSVSLMSYGKDNRNLFRFIRAGVTYQDSFGLTFSPFSYNIGYHLPVLDNLWVTPVYGYDSNHYVGISIGASL